MFTMNDLRAAYLNAMDRQTHRYTLRACLTQTGTKFHVIDGRIYMCTGGCTTCPATVLRCEDKYKVQQACRYFEFVALVRRTPSLLDDSIPVYQDSRMMSKLIHDRFTAPLRSLIKAVNLIRRETQQPEIGGIDLSQLTNLKALYRFELNSIPKMPLLAIANVYRGAGVFIIGKNKTAPGTFVIQVYDNTYKINDFIIELFVSSANPEESEIPQLTSLKNIPDTLHGVPVMQFMRKYNASVQWCARN
jgi:hypothetical protein